MTDYSQAYAFINALTSGQAETAIVDFRAIHDADKARPAIPFRDTLPNAWSSIVHYNSGGYGIFCTIAEMDGNGRELVNVKFIRAHYVDLDNVSAQQNYERAAAWSPAPGFGVQSSPGKFHIYWPVVPYVGNDRFQLTQRKLRQFFDGDKSVIDATRVMRLPGTLNQKYTLPDSAHYSGAAAHMVHCWSLPACGVQMPPEALEIALQTVNVVDGGGGRFDLGEPSLAAPSLDWLRFALATIDPNDLDRGDWISTTAAIKQAGWSLINEERQLYDIWSEWCARYTGNDLAENLKQWNSIRQTEVGWTSIVRRSPSVAAHLHLSKEKPQMPNGAVPQPDATPPMPQQPTPAPKLDGLGELLTDIEQRAYFGGCTLVTSTGKIYTPDGRFMDATKFNAAYGGKKFIIDETGKVTNEPWQAATRSTLWTIPKADHIRFLPQEKFGAMITDQLGRKGVNMFIPIIRDDEPGDITPFLRHMSLMLPNDATDQEMYIRYMAHNVKFPGFKIPWAPMLQSVEGIGKTFIQEAMELSLGKMYCYTPKAPELVKSGSTFNGWMRGKLMIIVNEIKVDERRELIEILKPMITDARVEIQSKGVDQELEDNLANWLFFSNYKDAIPINKSSRRYAIYYSPIQTPDDLILRGMNGPYFQWLFAWLRNGGYKYVSHYLHNYPIECGNIPMRAPDTSSTSEALRQSLGPVEQIILDSIEAQLPGFKNGWISSIMVNKRVRVDGMRAIMPKTMATILAGFGYTSRGLATKCYFAEDQQQRATIFSLDPNVNKEQFGRAQGYET